MRDNGKQPRLLFALDYLCIHRGAFRPNGAHRPDVDWRSDRDRQAEAQVFALPDAARPTRRSGWSWTGCGSSRAGTKPGPSRIASTTKKRSLMRSLLSNLHAAFGDDVASALGSGLVGYRPIVFGGNQVNLFPTREEGWPDPEHDLGALPLGEVCLGRVSYAIFENPLAPGEANLAGLGGRDGFAGAERISVPRACSSCTAFCAKRGSISTPTIRRWRCAT